MILTLSRNTPTRRAFFGLRNFTPEEQRRTLLEAEDCFRLNGFKGPQPVKTDKEVLSLPCKGEQVFFKARGFQHDAKRCLRCRWQRYVARWRQTDALSLEFTDDQVRRWIDQVFVPSLVREFLKR